MGGTVRGVHEFELRTGKNYANKVHFTLYGTLLALSLSGSMKLIDLVLQKIEVTLSRTQMMGQSWAVVCTTLGTITCAVGAFRERMVSACSYARAVSLPSILMTARECS